MSNPLIVKNVEYKNKKAFAKGRKSELKAGWTEESIEEIPVKRSQLKQWMIGKYGFNKWFPPSPKYKVVYRRTAE